MPHCRNGKLLKPGDRVTIECVVESVQEQTEYCNVTVRTAHPMPPYETGMTITLNTQQCEKLPDPGEL